MTTAQYTYDGRALTNKEIKLQAIPVMANTFGIEIECYPPPQNHPSRMQYEDQFDYTARILSEAGIDARHEGYNHQTRNHWKVVYDASVSGGLEVVSPILRGEAGIEEMMKVMRVLVANDFKVNANTGFHVHFGVKQSDLKMLKNFAKNYIRYEPVFDYMTGPSRRRNKNSLLKSHSGGGSKARIDRRFENIDNATSINEVAYAIQRGDRYYKLNYVVHSRQGTIEIRHLGGTINPVKAANWVRFLDALMRISAVWGPLKPSKNADVPTMSRNLLGPSGQFTLDHAPEVAAYWLRRVRKNLKSDTADRRERLAHKKDMDDESAAYGNVIPSHESYYYNPGPQW
jgi:hypothetical protein